MMTEAILRPNAEAQPRILLVEDNPIQAQILSLVVTGLGCQPLGPVETAAEALALCRQELPALAIIDIRLRGELNGIDLGMQLNLLGRIPLVFISSNNDGPMLHRMALLQPVAFLPKPYQPRVLQQIVSQTLPYLSNYLDRAASALAVQVAGNGIYIRESSTLVRLSVADITCVQAVQQHAVLIMESGRRYSVRLTLAEVLSQLPANDFIQCHRAWLINLQHIQEVELSANLVRIVNGTEAVIGRAYRQNIQQRLHILG